jgi:hypothetical protein
MSVPSRYLCSFVSICDFQLLGNSPIVAGLDEAGPGSGVSDPGYIANPVSSRPEQNSFCGLEMHESDSGASPTFARHVT